MFSSRSLPTLRLEIDRSHCHIVRSVPTRTKQTNFTITVRQKLFRNHKKRKWINLSFQCTMIGAGAKLYDEYTKMAVDFSECTNFKRILITSWIAEKIYDLSSIRMIYSTGSPLKAASFDFLNDYVAPGVRIVLQDSRLKLLRILQPYLIVIKRHQNRKSPHWVAFLRWVVIFHQQNRPIFICQHPTSRVRITVIPPDSLKRSEWRNDWRV